MSQLLKNNVTGVLATQVSAIATSINLVNAADFPDPAGNWYVCTLVGLNGNGQEASWEVVRVTAKAGNTLTVVRAQEGTTAVVWIAGTQVQMRLTAASVVTPTALTAAVSAHEAAGDPHPQYTTTAEASAAAPVQSVAGKTGVVTLVKADVGLSNVDNTSDANKPVSTATQTALNLKSDTTHTHGNATTSVAGFMSATDKSKLDGVASNANNYTHPTSGVAAGTYKSVTVNTAGHVTEGTNPTTLAGYGITDAAPSSHVGATGAAHGVATGSVAGFMAAADKTKLDGIAAGAQVNVATNIAEGTRTTTTVPITSSTGTGATLSAATGSLAGVMTSVDKTKLDGIAAGAQVNTVTSVASKTGAVTLVKDDVGLSNVDNTSDANKPVSTATQTALDGKANTSHTHTAANISDSTSVGRSVLTAADAASARTAIGAGTGNGDVTLTGTQTLTNKTLTGVRETRVAMPASDADLLTGNYFTRTISGTTTLTVSNVPAPGTTTSFILDLTNGGSATINWWSGIKWPGGTAPTLTASGRDVLGFFTHDGGTNWNGFLIGKDVK